MKTKTSILSKNIEQSMNINHEIISLWFPYLALEISFRHHTNFKKDAFAIISQQGNKRILYSINPIGKLLGLRLGMNLSEAHILCKNLKVDYYNNEKETSFMKTQAKWCNQFTPRISIERGNILLLNVKGCTHLFGNTENIIKKIHTHFKRNNISISSGFGENITSTKALAKLNLNKFEKKNFISKNYIKNNHNLFKKIPIKALELNRAEKEELEYLGIKTVHHLQSIPHKDLLTRFGPKLIKKLKIITGVNPELTSYLKPENVFSRSIKLPEPVGLISDIIKLFKKLTTSICDYLKDMNKGTRTLNFQLHRTDYTKQLIQIRTSQITAKPENFITLFKLKYHLIDVGFGIDFIRVFVHKIEDLFPIQNNLLTNNIENNSIIHQTLKKEEYKNLISKLSNKMGFDSLIHFHPNQSHIPENNIQKVSAIYCSPKLSWPISLYERPLLMFKPEQIKLVHYKKFPKLFIWRKKQYIISVRFGPERITAEWWLDNPQWRNGLRDYWKVETECGTRLWLFEAKGAELNGGWYIHGNFI